jgi:hypothetical protein
MQLGYEDAMKRREELVHFIGVKPRERARAGYVSY